MHLRLALDLEQVCAHANSIQPDRSLYGFDDEVVEEVTPGLSAVDVANVHAEHKRRFATAEALQQRSLARRELNGVRACVYQRPNRLFNSLYPR
jgi:hypothetical protein